jgi:putative addiction module component (TIGR02574 family)
MATTTLSGLLQLPRRKRLEIAERLWLSVAEDVNLPIPEEHERILNQRVADYKSGKSKPISHAELMRRVRAS